MNFLEYEKMKLENKTAEQICWKLFELTGQINYYSLFSALQGEEKRKEWTNLESREL